MKRRIYVLLLFAVFLAGCLGHLLLQPKKEALSAYNLTFKAENVNNLLLFSFPEVGDTLHILETPCELLEVKCTPASLCARKDGETLSRSSRLFSTVTLRMRTKAHEANGRLSLGNTALFLGDTVTLSGEHFSLSARFTGFWADFS